jgi:hypothetical protein
MTVAPLSFGAGGFRGGAPGISEVRSGAGGGWNRSRDLRSGAGGGWSRSRDFRSGPGGVWNRSRDFRSAAGGVWNRSRDFGSGAGGVWIAPGGQQRCRETRRLIPSPPFAYAFATVRAVHFTPASPRTRGLLP